MAQSHQPSPEAVAVVREVIGAFEAGQWARVAALIHPDALQQFRVQQLGMAHSWQDRPPLSEMRDTSLPASVAVYFDSMRSKLLEQQGNPGLIGFARVKTLEELDLLSPTELFARWLEGNELKPENYDDRRPPVFTRTILGSVAEGDSLVHVVYRIHTDVGRYGRTNETEVLTAKRASTGWRVLLNRDLSHVGFIEILDAPKQAR